MKMNKENINLSLGIENVDVEILLDDAKNVNYHHEPEDFDDGDLEERFQEYNKYNLILIDIDEIDVDEWHTNIEFVDTYMVEIEESIETMPIPVISDYYSIIDGTHRLNAMNYPRASHRGFF